MGSWPLPAHTPASPGAFRCRSGRQNLSRRTDTWWYPGPDALMPWAADRGRFVGVGVSNALSFTRASLPRTTLCRGLAERSPQGDLKALLPRSDSNARECFQSVGYLAQRPSPEYLLALKVAAARVDRDADDIRDIAGICGLVTAGEVLDVTETGHGIPATPATEGALPGGGDVPSNTLTAPQLRRVLSQRHMMRPTRWIWVSSITDGTSSAEW